MQQKDQLRYELEELWESDLLESMSKCRTIFYKVVVDMITRKWSTTALANEISFRRKVQGKNCKGFDEFLNGQIVLTF